MEPAHQKTPREPWERADGTLDAVKLQRTLRERVSKKLASMSEEEQIQWIEEEAQRFMSSPHISD